jgi:hypothetical protein
MHHRSASKVAARERRAARLRNNNLINVAAGKNHESACRKTLLIAVVITTPGILYIWITCLNHIAKKSYSTTPNGVVEPIKSNRIQLQHIRKNNNYETRNSDHTKVKNDLDSQVSSNNVDDAKIELKHQSPYTSDALQKNPYFGWQPTFPDPDASFSWRQCFSIRPTAPVSKLPLPCKENPTTFGKAPKVDEDWIPDVTMVRKMTLYGKDRFGHPFPPLLDKELCQDIAIMGGKDGDTNKECLIETKIKPTGPLNATTVTIDPSNHFGVDGISNPITIKAPTVMCLVYTMADAHSSRIQGMRDTWAGGCDGFLAFSTTSDPRLPAISLPHDGPEEYNNMWQKVRSIWKFVGQHYLQDYDWFFIGGDDLFVMPHNLKTYLASLTYKDRTDPKTSFYYVGRRFNEWGETYFNSGGAGYALSQATLREFLNVIDDEDNCSANKHTCKYCLVLVFKDHIICILVLLHSQPQKMLRLDVV